MPLTQKNRLLVVMSLHSCPLTRSAFGEDDMQPETFHRMRYLNFEPFSASKKPVEELPSHVQDHHIPLLSLTREDYGSDIA